MKVYCNGLEKCSIQPKNCTFEVDLRFTQQKRVRWLCAAVGFFHPDDLFDSLDLNRTSVLACRTFKEQAE